MSVPAYWFGEITASVNTVISNINTIINSSDATPRTSTFFFITDTHWRGNAQKSPEIALQTANAIDLAIDSDANISSVFKTNNANGYRRVIFAGDMIKGNAGTKEAASEEGNNFLNAWDNSFRVAVALGNHDTNKERNTSENILSTDEMHDFFLARENSYVVRDYLNKDVEIGYWNDTVNRIRFFMFRHYNNNDLSSSVWDKFNEYLDDITNAGWGAIFFCHSFWSLTEDALNPEHMQKPSGNIAFASKLADICSSKGIIPIALMVGHIHTDDSYLLTTENDNKILITSTVCDTYIGEATIIPSPSMTLGNSTEQAFEIVQVDMNYGKLYLTRVGAGFDRVFNIPSMNTGVSPINVPVINPETWNGSYNIMSVKFVNQENLQDFWTNAKGYIDTKDNTNRQEIEDQLYNWQKTDKAFAVQCEPVPNSELHPIVEFKFTETLPEGEKGSENPSTINGVSSVNVGCVGKNLLLKVASAPSWNGLSITANADGSYAIDGTFNGANEKYFVLTDCDPLVSGIKSSVRLDTSKTYTISAELISGTTSANAATINFSYSNTTSVGLAVPSVIGKNYISKVVTDYVGGQFIFRLNVKVGAVFNNAVLRFQLEEGTEATDFEPPMLLTDANYAISLNDTYYGGSLDVATGIMTVLYGVEIFTGSNINWSVQHETNTTEFYTASQIFRNRNVNKNIVCTHFKKVNSSNADIVGVGLYNNGDGGYFFYGNSSTTAEEFNTFLAEQYANNTPVTAVYELAVPFTVQLTPQQIKSLPSLEGTFKRINTVYTDVDSVQVEYQKYVGIDSTLDNNSVNAIQNKVVNSALNTKVSLSGDETINGTKTFSNTINGNITGNAGTVAGHIVSKDVPVNAAFTDTTYDPATQSTAGLMSASDKVKLDAVGSVFSFKGSVIDDTYLPASDNVNGDAYLAEDTGHVHVYDGSSFVDIGIWAGIPSATDAQIDALFED